MRTVIADTTIPDLASRFQQLEDSTNEIVVERGREVRGAILAILSGSHHLQLGPPGCAKTFMIDVLMKHISGARFMSVLLHGFSLMEDLYGPMSIKGMEEDRWLRKVETYLPWADFVFFDELFRCNQTLLNTNLTALNERKFRNDGVIYDIPLITMFAASNSRPEDPELQALDDRIHLRFVVGPIRSTEARLRMLTLRAERGNKIEVDPVISIDEIQEARRLVATIKVPSSVIETLDDLGEKLNAAQISFSDRKQGDAVEIIQATAFYNGRDTATIDDMRSLRDVFWTNPNDRGRVAELTMDLASPIDREAIRLAEDLAGLETQIEDIIQIEMQPIRVRKSCQMEAKLDTISRDLEELRSRATSQGITSEVAEETRKQLHAAARRLLERGLEYKRKTE